ncbi:gamma-glutamyltransferase [Pigmentiphaga kullae]|uniref:Glutathione hydrolase proenzyme n=1 Tax=Pigmentiphaga kullae TaxID=151784 RepID=A0A4Q7N7H4_9BURK|nr:gamma-glutamyltransferase [Pigmentiphaga kullae]RZS77195.1 gamma-glutamyltransferase 1 [Pigmentiphaga kullae]
MTSLVRASRLLWLACAALATAVRAAAPDPGIDANPEAQTAYQPKQAVMGRHFMAATAHPLATRAAYRVLERGGSAVDAAIAAQMMLGLVEPQSSGLGGGAFLVHYDASRDRVTVFDGRETAPAAANDERFMRGGRPMRFALAVDSGKSVGVPGLLRALELAHRQHGKLPWSALFDDAIDRARRGFPVSQRLAALLRDNERLAAQPAARAYFFHADGSALREGERLRNPELARTMASIAREGADAFYRGPLARAMVEAVRAHARPGDLSTEDLARYQARERAALCGAYRTYVVCGAPPPGSGGLAVLQMLALLEATPIARAAPESLAAVHYFSEAGRLAYADRDRYVADPDFVDVPVAALLDPAYLARRAALISADRSMGRAEPGEPVRGALARHGVDDTPALPSTTHLSIVDAQGNAVAMTSTIEQAFGSKILVGGFLLNNELTDFALSPRDDRGVPVANRVEPGKRPRSTMAPTIVLRAGGETPRLRLVAGSPGGSAIANYVARTLLANLAWGLDIQTAIDLPHYGSRNHATELESDTRLEGLAPALRAMGHPVAVSAMPSGLHGIEVLSNGLLRAGADPRREGIASGR